MKELYLHLGWRSAGTIFLSENPSELCDRLCLIIQEKQAGNDTKRFDNQIDAIFDKLLEYKCITPTQHKKNKQLILCKISDYIRWINISSVK